MNALNQLRVAILATDGFEETELTSPLKALKDAGALVDIVSIKSGEIQGLQHFDKGVRVTVDVKLIPEIEANYDALVLPGGAMNADFLRTLPEVKNFVKAFDDSKRPIAFICHAAWTLVSADLVRNRKLTSYSTIQDDIRNAGGSWSDQAVVVDQNWVSSRKPDDLPAFNREMIKLFSGAKRLDERERDVA